KDSALHFLKISCRQTAQDLEELKKLPVENTQKVYHAKFSDCQPYTEAIKSPNTVSRTILSNQYIPRVAMGTVKTTGPDSVAPHSHPMLEQLFLGLSENNCIVYADDNDTRFSPYSVLHIPLGSRHSVAVEEHKVMYYVWMDFFLDKKGEEWLETHDTIGSDATQ
ncbi:MAG: cupin domain-containing protein, partial [Pseudomonadota bacterium]